MAPFEVTDAAHIKAILQAFACLDDIRWSNPPKRTLVNYCSDDLTADEKLLTHWVTYITDRQMRFMRVWEIGGYVFSHLVRAFERSDRDVRSLVREYVRKKETGASNIAFQCPREGQNRRLELARMTEDPVQFASRYVPEDAFRVFRTLALLERTSDRRLGRFLSFFVSEDIPLAQSVRRLAVALDGLTYSAGARVTADQLEQELEQLPASVSYEAEEIRASPSAWLKSKERSFQPWGKKRLWCSLRDYLKGAEFNRHFVDALTGAGVATARRWRLENQELRVALDQLELPGDVWNNNKIFADGLFMPYLKNRPRRGACPKPFGRSIRGWRLSCGGNSTPSNST
jgi:hypothetical protein